METSKICHLCGKKALSSLYGMRGYWYCSHCNLAWVKKIVQSPYDTKYYMGKSRVLSKLFNLILRFFYLSRQLYASKKNIKLWVDVGAGDGGFLKTIHAKNKIGVEISSSAIEIMKKKGLGTMYEKKFLKSSSLEADVISFWHILEHSIYPWKYLAAAGKNIDKNGIIVVGVPNIDGFEARIFKNKWFHLVPNHHIWHFSPNSLSILLKQSNFKVEKIDYWSPEHHLTGVLQSFINITSGSDSVLHRLIKRSEDFSKISLADIFWSVFWLSLGFPIVFFFWVIGSFFHKSGTIVLVARKQNFDD